MKKMLLLIAALVIVIDQRQDLKELDVVSVVEASEVVVEAPVAPKADETPKEVKVVDTRITQIKTYLESYGSPIPDIATTIVEQSDKHGVDPFIITAIFCQESSCGKSCSNGNCTGYGKADRGDIGKTDFPDKYAGITGMIEKYSVDWNSYYKNCGTNIRCISRKYNPRESWVQNVYWFYTEVTS